jgi:hypothetical protein
VQFLVSRVSHKYKHPAPSPCEGAYAGEVMEEKWQRPPELTKVWFIDIASLEELAAFIAKEGRIIIDEGDDNQHKEIIIYDGYIE